MDEPGAETDRLELGAGALEGVRMAGELEGHGDVFQRRHGRHQMKILKDDADVVTAEQGQGVFVEGRNLDAGGGDGTRRRPFQPRHDQQQAGLARARGADDAEGLAGTDGEIDVVEDIDLAGVACQPEVHAVEVYGRVHHPVVFCHRGPG